MIRTFLIRLVNRTNEMMESLFEEKPPLGSRPLDTSINDKDLIHPSLLQHWKYLYKREVCFRFRETGKCSDGQFCIRTHGAEELRTTPIDELSDGVLEVFKTKFNYKAELCRNFQAGSCWHGPACPRAHGPDELRPPKKAVYAETASETGNSEKKLDSQKSASEIEHSVRSEEKQIDWFDVDISASPRRPAEVPTLSEVPINETTVGKSKNSDEKNDDQAVPQISESTDQFESLQEFLDDMKGEESLPDPGVQLNSVTLDKGVQTLPQVCLAGHCLPTIAPRTTFEELFAKKPQASELPDFVQSIELNEGKDYEHKKSVSGTENSGKDTARSRMDENGNVDVRNRNVTTHERVDMSMAERKEPEGQNRDAVSARLVLYFQCGCW